MTDWQGRARREAAAILAGAYPNASQRLDDYDRLVTLLAASWIQGARYGAHEGLEAMAVAFRDIQANLT